MTVSQALPTPNMPMDMPPTPEGDTYMAQVQALLARERAAPSVGEKTQLNTAALGQLTQMMQGLAGPGNAPMPGVTPEQPQLGQGFQPPQLGQGFQPPQLGQGFQQPSLEQGFQQLQPGQNFQSQEMHGQVQQTPDMTTQSFGGQVTHQQSFAGPGFTAQDVGTHGFEQQAVAQHGFDGERFLASASEQQSMQGQGFSTTVFQNQTLAGQATQQPGLAQQMLSGQSLLGQTLQTPNLSALAFDGQAFASQSFQGPLLQGQGFSAGQIAGEAYHGVDGSGQAFQGQFVQGQSFQGPFFQGGATQGQSFQAASFDGPNMHAQSFATQSFQSQNFSPTPPAPPAPEPPALKVDGQTIDTGRYQISADKDASLKVFDQQTNTFVNVYGDPHLVDSAGDKASFQAEQANLALADGTNILLTPTAMNDKGVSTLANVQVTKDGQTDQIAYAPGSVAIAENATPVGAAGSVVNLSADGDLNHVQVQTPQGQVAALTANGEQSLDQFAAAAPPPFPKPPPGSMLLYGSMPAPGLPQPSQQPAPAPTPPAPQLSESGNAVTDGRYVFTANELGTNTLSIYDQQTHSVLDAFGDTHLRDTNDDTGAFQGSSARLTLANGTQVVMNNNPVANGVATLNNVQITAGGKTDQFNNLNGSPALVAGATPQAPTGPVVELATSSDLNSIQVATSAGPQAALAPNRGNTSLDQFATPGAAG